MHFKGQTTLLHHGLANNALKAEKLCQSIRTRINSKYVPELIRMTDLAWDTMDKSLAFHDQFIVHNVTKPSFSKVCEISVIQLCMLI